MKGHSLQTPYEFFWLILFSIGLLAYQFYLRSYRKKHPAKPLPKSEVYWREALRNEIPTQTISGLEQALWHRLWEKGILQTGDHQMTHLPQTDQGKVVGSFLMQLQALQYSLNKECDLATLKQTAKDLFESI